MSDSFYGLSDTTNVGEEVGHLQNQKWTVFCQVNPTQWVVKILKFFLDSEKSVISQTQTLEHIPKVSLDEISEPLDT